MIFQQKDYRNAGLFGVLVMVIELGILYQLPQDQITGLPIAVLPIGCLLGVGAWLLGTLWGKLRTAGSIENTPIREGKNDER